MPLLLTLVGAHTVSASLSMVRLAGDTLSVQASQAPLQQVLQRFVDLGVEVRVDPTLNPRITADFAGLKVQRGLDILLKCCNFALIWESLPGLREPLPRLSAIHVFQPGRREDLKSMTVAPNLTIHWDPLDGTPMVKDEILLQLKAGVGTDEFLSLLVELGATVLSSHPGSGTYRVRLPENSDVRDLVARLSDRPGVAAVEPHYAYPIHAPQRVSAATETGVRSQEGSPLSAGVPIAVLDSGMQSRQGLDKLVIAALDAVHPDHPLSDNLGHGTQMALIASGVVAPRGAGEPAEVPNSLIPIRAFDDNGFSSTYTLLQSFDFAVEQGARVISLSWGTEAASGFLQTAFKKLHAQGVVVVAAAGNEPTGRPVYPAAYPDVIGVGALQPDGTPWSQSNTGASVTLWAPGFAELPVGYQGDPGTYAGTSIATAYAAATIAAYLKVYPHTPPDRIVSALAVPSP